MNEVELKLLRLFVLKEFKDREKEPKSLNFNIDKEVEKVKSFGFAKARGKILEKINQLVPKEEKKAKAKSKGKRGRVTEEEKKKREIELQRIKQEIEKSNEEFNESINEIIKNSNPNIDNYFKNATHYIKMVADGINNSLILKSNGGLGKTYVLLKTLNEMGLKNGKDYVYVNSYSTPLSFYEFLYHNKDKLIILDDFEGVLNNNIGVSILKSALWSATTERTVHYLTTSDKLTVPNQFTFKGRIIFCLNNGLGNEPESKALQSRALFYEINFSYQDTMKVIYGIAKQPYKDLTDEERLEVANYLKEATDETTDDLNFRTVIKAFDIKVYCKKFKVENWKDLVTDLVRKDEILAVAKQLMMSKLTVGQQINQFYDLTGRSRRTYFRLKKKLESAIVPPKKDVALGTNKEGVK